eukprot:TRINITY_DN67479_c0_g1_i1.p1 TRINITY_DN67479_c0_g1~~TRINITY_DN67479_c0_g1_i1.p1  ORF type:complete len:164 (-),score=33.78 TRINITY_DN67479_c0_g1_i1:51-542(-)
MLKAFRVCDYSQFAMHIVKITLATIALLAEPATADYCRQGLNVSGLGSDLSGEYHWTFNGYFYEKQCLTEPAGSYRIAYGDGTWNRTVANKWNLLWAGKSWASTKIVAVCEEGCKAAEAVRTSSSSGWPLEGAEVNRWKIMSSGELLSAHVTCTDALRAMVVL